MTPANVSVTVERASASLAVSTKVTSRWGFIVRFVNISALRLNFPSSENRIKGLLEIRDCVRKLIQYQTDDCPEEMIQTEQENLNRLYDAFTKKYGLINSTSRWGFIVRFVNISALRLNFPSSSSTSREHKRK